MMQGEGVGSHPHYGHHMPMDLHVPQHFPYYAGWVQSEYECVKRKGEFNKTKDDLFHGRISSHGPSLHESRDAKYLMFLMWSAQPGLLLATPSPSRPLIGPLCPPHPGINVCLISGVMTCVNSAPRQPCQHQSDIISEIVINCTIHTTILKILVTHMLAPACHSCHPLTTFMLMSPAKCGPVPVSGLSHVRHMLTSHETLLEPFNVPTCSVKTNPVSGVTETCHQHVTRQAASAWKLKLERLEASLFHLKSWPLESVWKWSRWPFEDDWWQ